VQIVRTLVPSYGPLNSLSFLLTEAAARFTLIGSLFAAILPRIHLKACHKENSHALSASSV
jgi:hypothetical protein